jgi:recombination protein U
MNVRNRVIEGDGMAVSYANRGMSFEHLIERTNAQYAQKGIATIQKVPVPWKVFYDCKTKSTVDFIGCYNGRAIAFDAKSTRERTRFPLSNIEDHQFKFLKRWQDNGGISFILVEFAKKNEVYIFPLTEVEKWLRKANEGGRKSVPYEYFMTECDLVKSKNGILLDYLGVIEKCKTS